MAAAGPDVIDGVDDDGVTSIVIVVEASALAAGTVLPALSAAAPAARRNPSVVSVGEPFVSVTTYGPTPLPETDATVQPVAVSTAKSPVAMPVTALLNVTEKVAVPLLLGEAVTGANAKTVGAVRSMVIVEATWAVAGPVLVAASTAESAASVRMTVPFVGLEAVTGIVYGPASVPVGVPTLQPVDVPLSAKSAAVRPVTAPEKVRL